MHFSVASPSYKVFKVKNNVLVYNLVPDQFFHALCNFVAVSIKSQTEERQRNNGAHTPQHQGPYS